MSSTAGAAILLGALAVLIAGGFIGMWLRDRDRAQEEATDIERIAPKSADDPHAGTIVPPGTPPSGDAPVSTRGSGPARPS
jgi:hypothetical protein